MPRFDRVSAFKLEDQYTSNTISPHVSTTVGLIHCNHERADTQIFLHSKHTASDGNNTITNKASDTDVLVILISALLILQDLGVEKMWVAFGQEQNSGFS
jgi:hypothetical protein